MGRTPTRSTIRYVRVNSMLSIRTLFWAVFVVFTFCLSGPSAWGADWPPINPDEIKMSQEPLSPEAPAVYLFRQVDRDDAAGNEYNYARIKVLKEEGRKYANVELQYSKGSSEIRDIRARVVQPDGTISNFEGQIYDRVVVKARGLRFFAKTFALPDVRVGSIIEYSYQYSWLWPLLRVYESHWILNEELFTKHAIFSLKPARWMSLRWSWKDLPGGTTPPRNEKGIIRLDVANIAAFEPEDYMPPPEELKARVDFVYDDIPEKDPILYWKIVGKSLNQNTEFFFSKRKLLNQALAEIVNPGDPPELKLQKLYERVQRIRNLSFEGKTAQEEKYEKLKDIRRVDDVWKRQYGDGAAIDLLFLALVRAAGFDAYEVMVSRRDEYLFSPQLPDSSRLNDVVVLVRLNGRDLYLDPGTAFVPFGLLPWAETAVKGLKLDKDGGSWVTTRLPDSTESRTERRAQMTLSEDGSLEGKLLVRFTGLVALSMRLEERGQDALHQKQFLEGEVKEWIPTSVEVDLVNQPDWNSSSQELVAEFNLKVPNWAIRAGRHELLPIGLFVAAEKSLFDAEHRAHPVYLSFPSEQSDALTISLPTDCKVSSLPASQIEDAHWMNYSSNADSQGTQVHLYRRLSVNFVMLDQKYYPTIRRFFHSVRTADNGQIVLQRGSASAGM